jgi:1-deoxy-D-xylulose 5-phosphate reductoisomerase
VAVSAFLGGRIPFGRIADVIETTLLRHCPAAAASLDAVRTADATARSAAERLLG